MTKLNLHARLEARGEYDFIIHGGRRGTIVVPGSRNIILTAGWDRLFTQASTVVAFCQVGTGAATPNVADTQLQNRVASTNTLQSQSESYVAGTPDYIESVWTFRFPEGTFASTNLSEVGVGWLSAAGLFSRALITVGGSPGTITVLADETLDVVFRFRLYPPQSDATGTVTLNGVSTNYTLRPANVNTVWNGSSARWSAYLLLVAPKFSAVMSGVASGSYANAFSGAIGARTSSPSGTQVGGSTDSITVTPQSYTNGSAQRALRYLWNLDDANGTPGTGFKSIMLEGAPNSNAFPFRYQVEFSPNVDKRSTMKLEIDLLVSFANRP